MSDKKLTDKELMIASIAFQNDKLKGLEPLVEKYGWEELFERFSNTVMEVKE